MTIKLKVLPKFPSEVVAGDGITIEKENGRYTFSAPFTVSSNYVLIDGTRAMTGALTLAPGSPSESQHAASKAYVDSAIATGAGPALDGKVSKTGDTMTGALTLPATTPGTNDAVRKKYVDDADAVLNAALAAKAPLVSPAFTGTPTAPTPPANNNSTRLATTAYVDAATLSAYVFNTKADAAGSTIPSGQSVIRTGGHYVVGDGGGGIYRKVTVNPPHNCKFTSADGAIWELAEMMPNLLQAGAKRDDATDVAPYLNDLMVYVAWTGTTMVAGGGGIIVVPSGQWNVATTIVPKSYIKVICAEATVFRVRIAVAFAQPAPGTPLTNFSWEGGIFQWPTAIASSYGLYLRTVQYSSFRRMRFINLPTGVGMVIKPDNGTSSAFNVFDGLEFNTVLQGMQLEGHESVPAPADKALITANHYTNILIRGVVGSGTGVNIVKYCDNEHFSNLRVELASSNSTGIDFNTGLPTQYGHVYGHDFDSLTIGAENVVVTGVVAIRLRDCYQINVNQLSLGPEPFEGVGSPVGGTVLHDVSTNPAQTSYDIQVCNPATSADPRQWRRVQGTFNKAFGASAIPTSDSVIVVTHGMPLAPNRVTVTPTSLTFLSPYRVVNLSNTQFEVRMSTPPVGAAASFLWQAEF